MRPVFFSAVIYLLCACTQRVGCFREAKRKPPPEKLEIGGRDIIPSGRRLLFLPRDSTVSSTLKSTDPSAAYRNLPSLPLRIVGAGCSITSSQILHYFLTFPCKVFCMHADGRLEEQCGGGGAAVFVLEHSCLQTFFDLST